MKIVLKHKPGHLIFKDVTYIKVSKFKFKNNYLHFVSHKGKGKHYLKDVDSIIIVIEELNDDK